jgi:hypothetical protein
MMPAKDRMPTHGYCETREGAMAAFAKSWWRELKKAPSVPGLSRLANEGRLEWAEYSRPTLLSRRRLAMTIRVSPAMRYGKTLKYRQGELPQTEVAACRIATASCAPRDGTQARSQSSRVENRADAVSAACEHVSWLGERLSVLPCPSIRTPP